MSTRTTESLVPAPQGGNPHGAPVHGHRAQQAEPGKSASAGFAQILGEQVAKSAPKAEAAPKVGAQFMPVSPSSPNATPQSLSRSPSYTTPQPLPRPVSGGEHRASSLVQMPLPIRAPIDRDSAASVTPAKITKPSAFAQTVAGQSAPASSPSVRMLEVSRSERTLSHEGRALALDASVVRVEVSRAPAGEAAVRVPAPASHRADPAQATASGIKPRVWVSENAAQRPSKTGETTAPLPSKLRENQVHENPVHVPAQAKQPAIHAPVPAGSRDLPAQPTASDNTPRVSIKPNASTMSVASKADEAAVQIRDRAANTAHSPAPAMPAVRPTDVAKHATRPTPTNQYPATFTKTAHTAHVPASDSIPSMPEPNASKSSLRGTATPSQARPGAQIPASAPPSPTRAEQDIASADSPAHIDRHAVADGLPAHDPKPQKHPVGTQAIPVAQAVAHPIAQPSSPRVAQDTTAPQVPRTPDSVSAPETPHPTATTKVTAKAAVAKPTTDPPSVLEETRSTESPSNVKTPEPHANKRAASTEDTARATTDNSATAGPKHAPALPTPEAGHLANKNPVQVEPTTSKKRAQLRDKEEPEEATTSPAKSSQTSPLPSLSSSSASVEFKAPKPDVPPSAEQRTTPENSSQTTSLQSAVATSHAMKEEFLPGIVAPAERPTVLPTQTTFLPATGQATVNEVSTPGSVATERASLVDRVIEDPGLSVTVMPHSAHLSITGDAGDLALHVRVRDGSADVNVSGTLAPLFDSKAPEVRTVLAGEGLQLGSFATDQRGGSQGQHGQPENAPATNDPHPLLTPRRISTLTPEVEVADDRRIHVTA